MSSGPMNGLPGFPILSQQNFVNSLPRRAQQSDSGVRQLDIEPVLSPNHDLILIPSHPSAPVIPPPSNGGIAKSTGHEPTVTMAHLQKPLFKENLWGPFSFRPDGLLLNSGADGIMMDQERRKWRGGVGEGSWIELQCPRITLGSTLSVHPNISRPNLKESSSSSSNNHDEAPSTLTALLLQSIGGSEETTVYSSLSNQPQILTANTSTSAPTLQSTHSTILSASPLLGPLYVLYDDIDYPNILSRQLGNQSGVKNFAKVIFNHEIDSDMDLLVPDNHTYLLVLHNEQTVTLRMYGWIKIATYNMEVNDMYPQSKIISYQQENQIHISVAEYGDYGIMIGDAYFQFQGRNDSMNYSHPSLNDRVSGSSNHLISLQHTDQISRHLAHVQYLLLDKLPKVVDYIENTWNSFFTGGFKKTIVDSYESLIKASPSYRGSQEKNQEGGPSRPSHFSSPFISSFISLLINGECTHWDIHKEWLTTHANEKNILKLIRALNSTKTIIISYIVNFVEVYIKHSLLHLSNIRAQILHQKYSYQKDVFSETLCSSMIERVKEFYQKSTLLSNQITSTHANLMNLLSFLLIHQGKSLSPDKKYTPPDGIVATFDNFQLTQFLYSLGENGLSFEESLRRDQTSKTFQSFNGGKKSSSGTTQTISSSSTTANTNIFDPLSPYFSVDGMLKRIHQLLIVDLSTLIDNFSAFINRGLKTPSQQLNIPVYEPSQVSGFHHKSTPYWAFVSEGKWVCLKIENQTNLSLCVFSIQDRLVQYKFYKNDPQNNLLIMFLQENDNQESTISLTSIGQDQFIPCSDLSEITSIVDNATQTLPIIRMQKCDGQISQISVGIRGLCAAFGKQQFWIYDLEGEEEDDGEEEEDGENADDEEYGDEMHEN